MVDIPMVYMNVHTKTLRHFLLMTMVLLAILVSVGASWTLANFLTWVALSAIC
jgi:hypothetical protein